MKKITLDEILHHHKNSPYHNQCEYIMELIGQGRIKPIAASGTNGKKPALCLKYWLVEEHVDYTALEDELKYMLHPKIVVDYYLAHPEIYAKDRQWVRMLDSYLKCGNNHERGMSVNERSFEIWHREKFLTAEGGEKILKRCGLSVEDLNVYPTTEPLAYYSHTRNVPQNILILENKDTFYSMRQYLTDGGGTIMGVDIGTLIYGAGKKIVRTFHDFDICVEPYLRANDNTVYYFGDLDYEGIIIYESLAHNNAVRKIQPFIVAYDLMLDKAERDVGTALLPDTKEGQNRNIGDLFFSYFSCNQVERMKELLESGKYIPQEIINISDL